MGWLTEIIKTNTKPSETIGKQLGDRIREAMAMVKTLTSSPEREKEKENAKVKAARVRENDSPTATGKYLNNSDYTNSTEVEDYMWKIMPEWYSEDPKYFLPYIEDKEIKVKGNRISTNQLDSLAKYAGQAGVPKEAIGLAAESIFGSVPIMNTSSAAKLSGYESSEDDNVRDRILSNANYNRAFGGVPASAMIRDFEYTTKGYLPKGTTYLGNPLLHGFDYFDRGLYNPGYKYHSTHFYNVGKEMFKEKQVQNWWNTSGRYYYTLPRTEESKKALKSYNKIYPKGYNR